ncbi:MAG: methyltransferase domain-containing protein [Actinomycetota bacterium]
MDSPGDATSMTGEVSGAYDRLAARYGQLFLGRLEHDGHGQRRLDVVAAQAAATIGPIADLGCGPGDVVAHLSGLGVKAVGYDLSAGQIAQARSAFPPPDGGRPFDQAAVLAGAPDPDPGG